MNSQKGITLISLVITIIIMLILAAVSISTIIGEGGIIAKASDANLKTKSAKVEEEKNLNNLGTKIDELTNIIPEGGTYYVNATIHDTSMEGDYSTASAIYTAGQKMPETVSDGDVYVYGDYEYRYNYHFHTSTWEFCKDSTIYYDYGQLQNGWGVRVLDTSKTKYGAILENINGKPVTDMYDTFYNCQSLTKAPKIPNNVKLMRRTFGHCSSLTDLSDLVIPSSVENLSVTFYNCTSLTSAPDLSVAINLKTMKQAFKDCSSLTGDIEINANIDNTDEWLYYGDCFYGTILPITLKGTSTALSELAKTDNNGNVTIAE